MIDRPAPPAPMSTHMQPLASRSADLAAAIAGAIAAFVAIAVGEALAGILSGAPSLVIAIGDLVIDLQPPGAKDIMVELFGDADKTALNVIIVVAAGGIAAALGVAARRRWSAAVIGFLVAGGFVAIAALRQPLTDRPLAILTVALAVAAGLGVLRILVGMTEPAWQRTRRGPVADTTGVAGTPGIGAAPGIGGTTGVAGTLSGAGAAPDGAGVRAATASMPDWDRRRFLITSGAATVGAAVAGVVGRSLLEGRAGGPPPGSTLPPSTADGSPAPGETGRPMPALPPGAELDVPGITPLVIPNDRFYRIDTALVVPRVDVSTWTLTISGMVDTPVTLTYDQLLAMPLFDQYVTIACVSNEVGGRLVGNALWTGVHLRDVLEMAGVQAGATQLVGRSVDGFTTGFPTEWAMEPARDPMIAVGMNGKPLPGDHGYPARLIIPGLFGYVSATKWLSDIVLTRWEDFDAYWVPLGWAKKGPILTQSRIDVPRPGSTVTAGPVPIAGVAWAPDRGIDAVEVQVDDGDWLPASLSAPLSDATWVQWLVTWDAAPGTHTIAVRATDGTGEIQTADITRPAPDGARGHHTIEVTVAA